MHNLYAQVIFKFCNKYVWIDTVIQFQWRHPRLLGILSSVFPVNMQVAL